MQVRDSQGHWVEQIFIHPESSSGASSGDPAPTVDTSELATHTKQDLIITEITKLLNELQLHSKGDVNSPIVITKVGTQRTPTFARSTSTGVIEAGMTAISITNVGLADGTVTGTILKPDEQVTFKVINAEDTLSEISYDGTGTEFTITTLS